MFVAINYISCKEDYKDRFEELFKTRAGAIDQMPGFMNMHVLKPSNAGDEYLVVSHWENEHAFKAWTQSDAFLEGHKRGFADIAKAREEGKEPPMKSTFRTYHLLSR